MDSSSRFCFFGLVGSLHTFFYPSARRMVDDGTFRWGWLASRLCHFLLNISRTFRSILPLPLGYQ